MKTRAPFLGRARRADRSPHAPPDGSRHDVRPPSRDDLDDDLNDDLDDLDDELDDDAGHAPSLVRQLLARALQARRPADRHDDGDAGDAAFEDDVQAELGEGDVPDDEAHDGVGAATLVALGFAGGLTIGAFAWSRLLESSARQLFSRSRARRYWAVSYLGARPSVDTARLLRDYVRWEPHPLLRRRARRVLAAVEAALGR